MHFSSPPASHLDPGLPNLLVALFLAFCSRMQGSLKALLQLLQTGETHILSRMYQGRIRQVRGMNQGTNASIGHEEAAESGQSKFGSEEWQEQKYPKAAPGPCGEVVADGEFAVAVTVVQARCCACLKGPLGKRTSGSSSSFTHMCCFHPRCLQSKLTA